METKPTLALIPSAYKAGKVYSVLPADGVGDFDFSRSGQATRVNKDGLIETVGSNVPRLNYPMIDGVVSGCPSLLLEPQRTNVLPYSEDFSNAAWIKSNATIISNSIISPNGSLNADELQVTSSGGNIYDNVAGSGDGVFSVFAKYKDVQYIRLRSTNSYAFFDIKNGVLGGTISTIDTKIEKYPNGWYKCSVIGNNTNSLAQIFVSSDGVNVGLGNVYLWGAQLEEGSYATSYIPTSGSIGTRDAENAYQQNVTQLIGQSEGTMYIEFIPKDTSAFQILYQIRSSSGTIGQTDIRLQDGNIRALANDGGSSQFNIDGGSYIAGTTYKVAVRYKLNDSNLYINGSSVGTDKSCSFTGSSLDQVSFAENLSSFSPIADILDARLYDTALTDAELAALTS